MTIAAVTQQPDPGAEVILFRLDTTNVGGTILYFCQGALGDAPVSFGGQEYAPIDIQMSDFEVNAGGSLPQPKLRIKNTDNTVQGMVNAFGDLAGCEIRRVRTFARFLDGQPDEDPTSYIGPDVFRVERLAEDLPSHIEWELSAAIDQEGKMLPGGLVLRDTCVHRYRIYDPSSPKAALDGFVYPTINPCPYTGAPCFTASGQATTAAQDRCGRKVSDCELRFGIGNPLPFGGFPGVARVS